MPMLQNQKHERMAQALGAGKPASRAYVEAGYKPSRSAAQKLSTKPYIQNRVAELQGPAAKKAGITVERLINEYEKIAFSDPTRFMIWNEDGSVTIKRSDDISKFDAAAIQSIENTKFGLKLKFYDKRAALDSIAKISGFVTDKSQVNLDGDLTVHNTITFVGGDEGEDEGGD